MSEKRPFLYWALAVALLAVFAVIAAKLGAFTAVFVDDPTRVTVVTGFVFLLGLAWSGRLFWRLCAGTDPERIAIDALVLRIAFGACLSLGLLGTVYGFRELYGSFTGAMTPASAAKTFAFAKLAFVNTLFGGICGFILEMNHGFARYAVALKKYQNRHRERVAKAIAAARPDGGGDVL